VRHLKNRGIGVLITDHNVRETLGICDRAYILNEAACSRRGSGRAAGKIPMYVACTWRILRL